MFKFKKKQKMFEIGRVKVGGQPGELPTVLIGSIFHRGHNIVEDPKLGVFDKEKAEHLINMQEVMSENTGNPCMLDVVGENFKALKKYIDFVSKVTDAPLLINGPTAPVRVKATSYAKEIGLLKRVVYNSINFTVKDEEIRAIKNVGVKSAIVQAFNPQNPWPEGMLHLLKVSPGGEGLLRKASKAGIEKPLILTPVLDVPSVGLAARGIYLAKKKIGIPTGTAPIGVVGRWKRVTELGRHAKRVCRGGAAALVQSMGTDFIIYGSVAKAKNIFPVCAMIDAIVAYNAKTCDLKPLTDNHPLYKIF